MIAGAVCLTTEVTVFLYELTYSKINKEDAFNSLGSFSFWVFCESILVGIGLTFGEKRSYLSDKKYSRHKLYGLSAKLNEQDILVSPTALQTATVIEEKVSSIDSVNGLEKIDNTTYFCLSDNEEKIRILKEVRSKINSSANNSFSVESELFLLEDGDDISNVSAKTLKLNNNDYRRRR